MSSFSTAALGTYLRAVAKRPTVNAEDAKHLIACADRLDWYGAKDRRIVDALMSRVDDITQRHSIPLPHSQDARKAAMAGEDPHFARVRKLRGADVAKALGAEPAGKAPTRAAAHMPRKPTR